MDKNNVKKAYCYNIVTFILILFSTVWMFSGIRFGNAPAALEASRLAMLRYYTVDSNIIMGLVALCIALLERKIIRGELDDLPTWARVLNLLGVVGVTLTMLVTIFFLTPTMGFITCFNNSNLFLHLVNPVVSIYTYLRYEATDKVSFAHTFTGITSMLIYAVFYLVAAATHSHGNVVDAGYDWYGFLVMGLNSAFIVIPIIVLVTYLICLVLWTINRRIYRKG